MSVLTHSRLHRFYNIVWQLKPIGDEVSALDVEALLEIAKSLEIHDPVDVLVLVLSFDVEAVSAVYQLKHDCCLFRISLYLLHTANVSSWLFSRSEAATGECQHSG